MKIMRRLAAMAGAGLALTLTACGPQGGGAPAGHPAAPSLAERGYVSPPAVISAQRLPGGQVLLSGTASPTAKVRLASPAGAAVFALADRAGAWSLALPGSGDVRLFGLSMPGAGRAVQAEGYLVVAPSGLTAELRPGSGAVVLTRVGPGVAIQAADFDSKGGAVLSGVAPAKTMVTVSVDGAARGRVNAGAAGRFTLSLNEPLKPGNHVLAAAATGAEMQESLTVSAADRPAGAPFRAQAVDGGWRIDWLTPGGGVQTTVLYGGATP